MPRMTEELMWWETRSKSLRVLRSCSGGLWGLLGVVFETLLMCMCDCPVLVALLLEDSNSFIFVLVPLWQYWSKTYHSWWGWCHDSRCSSRASTRYVLRSISLIFLCFFNFPERLCSYNAFSCHLLFTVIEKYTSNTRFCMICNYVNKITPALQSRCTR